MFLERVGGEDSRAMEEDRAFLSLIMSDVIWREKQKVGSTHHISLAEFQRRETIQGEGTPGSVSPWQTLYATGPSAGWWVGLYPTQRVLARWGLSGKEEMLAASSWAVASVEVKRQHWGVEATLKMKLASPPPL